jgi:hypothetical protein
MEPEIVDSQREKAAASGFFGASCPVSAQRRHIRPEDFFLHERSGL